MKTHRLQAAFARKREAEHVRIEKSTEVNRYFDHWGKVTSRYENWTTPEYYEQADENLRKTREKQRKDEQLDKRRQKLRELLCQEKAIYESELNLLRKPKPRRIETSVLERIGVKTKEEARKRMQLEAKLYQSWRGGRDFSLYDSKSNNAVMAKLNWMDKQIEEQMQREEEERESARLNLQMQEEYRKREENMLAYQQITENEIKELKALQQTHLEELQNRDAENVALKQREDELRTILEKLEAELSLVGLNRVSGATQVPHNVNRIKMIIRKRSESFLHGLKSDIELLVRINHFCDSDSVRKLISEFQEQYAVEQRSQTQIEGMYESEAKHSLRRFEEIWRDQATARERQIVQLLTAQKREHSAQLTDNLARQRRLIEVRETHLSSIETANEKLKHLIKEQQHCSSRIMSLPEPSATTTGGTSRNYSARSTSDNSEENKEKDSVQKIIKDFSEFYTNNDRARTPPPSDDPIRCGSAPKFGRKRVAWM